FSLEVASGDVVERDDSANRALCFASARSCESGANHNSDLSLEFHALRLLRKNYRFSVSDDARRRFQKKQGLRRNVVAHLFLVLAIIAANTNNLPRTH